MVIWIIGLAGAGKTTIGREVHKQLRAKQPNVVFLDGDHIRHIMGDDLGHTLDDRRRNGWRICRLCQCLDNQGIDVVCSVLSLFGEQQTWNRENYSGYFEVFIDVRFEELVARDQKGLYSKAIAGELCDVAGVDLAFHRPNAHLVIDNNRPLTSPQRHAARIVAAAQLQSSPSAARAS